MHALMKCLLQQAGRLGRSEEDEEHHNVGAEIGIGTNNYNLGENILKEQREDEVNVMDNDNGINNNIYATTFARANNAGKDRSSSDKGYNIKYKSDSSSDESSDVASEEKRYKNDDFCEDASNANAEDEAWTGSMKESESSESDDDEFQEVDYDDEESELDDVNGYDSDSRDANGAVNDGQGTATRRRRNTARPATYQESSEDSDDDEEASYDSSSNDDSDQSSRIRDDYPLSEHESDIMGPDDDDDDASVRTGNEDNMSDNDYPEQGERPKKQKTITDCKPFYVRKE